MGRIAPFSSAISMNSPGTTRPAVGVLPAHERLEPGDASRLERHDRLVDEAQLPEVDRVLEIVAQLVTGPDRGMHGRVEDREAGLAIRLGHVHRHVGVTDQLLRIGRRHPAHWRCRCWH